MRNFVIIGIMLYFISVALYIFVDETPAWGYYFNIVSTLVCVFLVGVVFKALIYGLNNKEITGILYLALYKLLTVLYLIATMIFCEPGKKPSEAFSQTSFLVMLGVAGFLAWFVSKPLHGKLYEKSN